MWYKAFSGVFAVLVCASTVLVKQHVLLDIPAGILLAEFGLLMARLFKVGDRFRLPDAE